MALSGKFEADFSEFYSAVTQATSKLVDFEAGARSVEDRLNTMAQKFSGQKVIQEATLMAKAIEEAGGVSKLTEAELARVGKTANEAAEKMKRLGLEVPANLQQLADATKKTSDETQTLSVSVTDMVKAYVSAEAVIALAKAAWSALIGVLQDSITSAAEAESADRALLAALEAQGTAMPSVVSAYQGYAAALQQTTIYSDDAVTAAQTLLAQVGGVMPRDMEKATLATANLAAALGKDLPDAAMIMAKAATGSTEALNKYGIETTDANGKTLEFAEVVDKLNEKFSGAAAAAADTYAGRIKQLGNAWDNVQESIGRAIIQNESLQTLIKGVTGLVTTETGELKQNQTVTNLVSDAAIGLAKAASFAAEGIQWIGTTALAARTSIDAFAMGLTQAYIWLQKIEEFTQKKVEWTLGTEESSKRIVEAQKNLAWAYGQMKELRVDMSAAVQTNKDWTAAIDEFQANLGVVITKMEAARGSTVTLTAAQKDNANAWQLNTGAMNAQLIAVQDVAKGVANLKTGFEQTGPPLEGLTTKLGGLGPVAQTAMSQIVTGADGAAAAVFKITTEAQGATAALQAMSAVQSGVQLALPQGGTGEAYAPWAVTSNVNPMLATQLSQRYGTSGAIGATANPWSINQPGSGSTVNMQSGAVQMNYPIMNDPQAMDQLARVVGDAIMTKMTRTGTL